MLLTAGSRSGEATGKLFEYLAAGRPMLVLGDRTEAARIVRDAAAGLAVPVDDAEAIAGALERLGRGELALPPAAGRQRYAYPRLAARLSELIEEARERRKSSR